MRPLLLALWLAVPASAVAGESLLSRAAALPATPVPLPAEAFAPKALAQDLAETLRILRPALEGRANLGDFNPETGDHCHWIVTAVMLDPANNLPRLRALLKPAQGGWAANPEGRAVYAELRRLARVPDNGTDQAGREQLREFGAHLASLGALWRDNEAPEPYRRMLGSLARTFDGVGLFTEESAFQPPEEAFSIEPVGALKKDRATRLWNVDPAPALQNRAILEAKALAPAEKALEAIDRAGIDLGVARADVVLGLPAHRQISYNALDGGLLMSADLLKVLSADKFSGVAVDALVRHILAAHLLQGLPEPLRMHPIEIWARGLGPLSELKAKEAIARFKRHWLDNVYKLEAWLKVANGANIIDNSLAITFPVVIDDLAGVAFDLPARTSIIVSRDGRYFPIRDHRAQEAGRLPGKVHAVAFDSARGVLYAAHKDLPGAGTRLAAYRMNDEGRLEALDVPALPMKQAVDHLWVRPDGLLLAAVFDAEENRTAVIPITPQLKGTGRVGFVEGKILAGEMKDDGKFLIVVAERPRPGVETGIFVYPLDDHGVPGPFALGESMKGGVARAAVLPDSGLVALASADQALFLARLPSKDEGIRLDRWRAGTAVRAVTAAGNDLVIETGAGFRLLPGNFIEALTHTKTLLESVENVKPDLVARAVAEALMRWPKKFWTAGSHIGGYADLDLTRRVWDQLGAAASPSAFKRLASLKPSKKAPRWFPGSEEELRRRMPTLHAALADPVKLGLLLERLALLRAIYPYDRTLDPELPPLEAAKKEGFSFPLNELKAVPVSESFRRHILYVEDAGGLFAVELKIPGQAEGRQEIGPAHFDAARELWEAAPEEGGTAKPLFFGGYTGSLWLYDRRMRFSEDDPLGVVLFEYRDGRRYRNATEMIERIAKETDRPHRAILENVLEDVAVAVIRLHELGWSGSYWRGGTMRDSEMHAENFRVLADGRGELVSDFNIFHKRAGRRALSLELRRAELMSLLLGGMPAEAAPVTGALLASIYPKVVARLTRGVADAGERARLAEVARRELGL